MKIIDGRLSKLEDRFVIARSAPSYLLILTDREVPQAGRRLVSRVWKFPLLVEIAGHQNLAFDRCADRLAQMQHRIIAELRKQRSIGRPQFVRVEGVAAIQYHIPALL